MAFRIPVWLKKLAEDRNNKLLKKIVRSLERDRSIPFSYLIRKTVIYFVSMITGRFNLWSCNRVGQRPRTRRRPNIENMGQIFIGDDVNINSRNVQTDLVTGPEGTLEIGNEVSINFGVSIVANEKIVIGDRIRIGPYTMIYDSNMHVHGNRFERASGEPVIIEDDSWLASKVIVLKGSRIGKGSLIAAGSVVSGIIPPYVIAGGIPAKVIKYLDPPSNSGFLWEHNERTAAIREDTLYRVRKVASEIFSTDINLIQSSNSHFSLPNWNSLQHVKFIHALEREFDIVVKKEDWTKMSSIGKIARVIQTYSERMSRDQLPVNGKD